MTESNRRQFLFGGLALLAAASPAAALARETRGSYTRNIYLANIDFASGEYVSVTHETPLSRGLTTYTNRVLTREGELYVNEQTINQDGAIINKHNRILTKDGKYIVDGREQSFDQQQLDHDLYMIDVGIDTFLREENNQRFRIGTARQDLRIITSILTDAFVKSYFIRDIIDTTLSISNFRDARERTRALASFSEATRGDYGAFRQTLGFNLKGSTMQADIQATRESCDGFDQASPAAQRILRRNKPNRYGHCY